MITSRKFVAAAILTGLGLVVAGLVLAPLNGGARAASGQADAGIAADRIGAAFASLPEMHADSGLVAAADRALKGDLGANCASATWPNVDASCLATADGRAAPHVRTITIGYQADAATTVLLRVPASEVAQR